jgi:hypothetical protein
MVPTWKKLAFSDEVAALSDDDPADIGTTAAEGVGITASRDDHVHKLGADVVGATNVADDAIGSEHIEALSAALDCNKQQLTAAALDNQVANPATPVLGQIYFHSGVGELHPYICTAVA